MCYFDVGIVVLWFDWSVDIEFEVWIAFGVGESVMKFWGIMAHINEIGDVWGIAMAKGKLVVEETGGGRTHI